MNPFSLLLNEIIYRPIFNILILFLSLFQGNLGIAIICLTLIVRLALLKPTLASTDMQKGMGDMWPKMQEIQEKYADDPKRLQEETMKLFKTQGLGPLKGCLMTLLQLPVFIGLFYVVNHITDATIMQENIYSFFQSFGRTYTQTANISTTFLGIDLLKGGNIRLAGIAAVLMYFQMQITLMNKPAQASVPGAPDLTKSMGVMNIFLVFMMASFVYASPASIGLYIVTTTIFSLVQLSVQYQHLIKVKLKKIFG